MERLFKFGICIVTCLALSACAGGMHRLAIYNSLKNNDINSFKTQVNQVNNDQSLSEKDRARKLYEAFYIAAETSLEATKYLYELGVPIDYPKNRPHDSYRGLVLASAVERHQYEITKYLLSKKADPNIKLSRVDFRNNVLYIALLQDDLQLAKTLLDGGANPNLWQNTFYSGLLVHFDGQPQKQHLLTQYGAVENPTLAQRVEKRPNIFIK